MIKKLQKEEGSCSSFSELKNTPEMDCTHIIHMFHNRVVKQIDHMTAMGNAGWMAQHDSHKQLSNMTL